MSASSSSRDPRGGGGVPSSTINETMKITITKTLMKLREDKGVEFVEFPSTLTNVERKYVHKIASELGLKSKSYGSEDDRKIKVTKLSTEVKIADASLDARGGGGGGNSKGPVLYKVDPQNLERLLACFGSITATSSSISSSSRASAKANASGVGGCEKMLASAASSKKKSSTDSSGPEPNSSHKQHIYKPLSAKQSAESLARSHSRAQTARAIKPEFAEMQRARSKLPSFAHAKAVCDLVKTSQIILIAGDTGKVM
jgi:hypothetical protein